MDPKFVIIYNSGTLAITLDPQMDYTDIHIFFHSEKHSQAT